MERMKVIRCASMKKTLIVMLAAACLAACSKPSPAMQMIETTAEALGGKARIQQINTLTLEGDGEAPNLGQNLTTDSELPVWKAAPYRRSIDVAAGRMRVRQTRTAQFLFAGATTQQLDQGVDGNVGYNMPQGQGGMPSRTSESVAKTRRVEMFHHPISLIRLALTPGTKVDNLRTFNNYEAVDVTTPQGDVLTFEVDRATRTPLRVRSMSYNDNLGDVAIETAFAEYETVEGLKMPRRLITKIDKYPQFDFRISKNTVDGENPVELSAPAEVKAMSVPPGAAVTVTSEEVGKGIWWLAGSGNHRSIVVEFDDHLVLFEVPLNELRTKAVIDTARSLRPQKPLTHAVVSHHHFDHSGGLRVAVAEGLTIVTYKGNVEFFKDLVSRKHSIVQDALARSPKPMKIEPVDDELVMKDKSMELRLYHVKNNPREGTNLFGYVPRDKMLVQADLYDSAWLQHPWGDNLAYNIGLRKLQVAKSVPVHGTIESYSDVLKTIASKKPAAKTEN